MDTNTLDSTPRVWIGCLHCYNSGRLVGEWFDAVDADGVTLADVHRGEGGARGGCEELWCFDHENLPVRGEMSPHEAAEWGSALASVPEHQREALCAWVRSGDYVAEGTGDLPSIPDFEDRYCGEWESFREYAEELADGTGLLSGVPDDVARYFDWSAWTRDLAFDYTVEDAPGGGVFVFRNV
ncbi:antirestriction protein ArdA [Propionibacterium freudenreichii]|uniref:antirestriction protein ArdA n=1 Tax=Propionibacterium freudenreichii TaxID=1744 RepID=UPI0021A608C8|nr:antirestriction protein ArdA [Propionibacterium freudenreichii]MCT2999274.1 antirestriction protein ArdA [Propionibacterium freudenreichii]MDK9639411.1 antirestriction protein ArdA [Propionibacterium freudenreichii]